MQRFGFLLIPGFSMLSLAAAVEPLRMANAQAEEELYQWDFLSWGNTSVNASNNMVTAPTIDVDQVKMLDVLLVVAGINVATYGDDVFFAWLRQASRQVDLLGSTSTGALLLAKAKLLRHKTCTIHWEYVDSFREQFPDVWMSGELYEFDGSLFTCSGGSAGLDMMLQIIADQHGYELALLVAEQYMHPHIRPPHQDQRMRLQSRLNINNPRLIKALDIMRQNLEAPLTCQELADASNMSARQMERLFKQYLHQSPGQYYLHLRLEKTQQLLRQSSLSVLQVATACGFSSTSYLARCYQKKYACSPRQERARNSNR
ncbi:MAG: GlxA family transcriptional regulator [Oceanospirillaceae bacterium]|jgi:transcriptional regulator GlxA family with amidase domain|nr:GlxA family transcriptional regulator [Oceanospirillaceae bacterium]MBT6101666.1 GlxA family transcriptional regulator [Oceanospirillaceae bacterium]MDA9044201.1 GlxA family transcriptional regulator [bacterium]MDO7574177.1 GlxA family transcriptional regulator [Oceanospirillaceae bacterium]